MYSVKKISIGLYCVATICLQYVKAESATTAGETALRAEMVKNAFKHAWEGYSNFAYGHDELQPMTNGTTDSRYIHVILIK
jgi:mannosyl-oligosaccharide alpha-1,2-mannosidase